MFTFDRSLVQQAAAAACVVLCLARTGGAQQQEPVAAPQEAAFFSRYDFHMSAAALAIDDPRFSWDTHFGGELDVFDYVVGRTSMLVDFEAVLGDEFRAFDPNQGNYTLEVSSSARVSGTEVAVMFHHVSRHLSDRPKPFAVAWNVLGARVLRHQEVAGLTVDADVDAGAIVQHSYADYRWIGNANLRVGRQLSSRVGVYARGTGHVFGVDSTVRGTQVGGAGEAGVRIGGKDGVLELFAGVERRVDADPLDFLPQRWVQAGFRLLRR
jgi:hypothetical protein